MILTLIAMMGANRVIGRKGRVPWHIQEDMARFKALTWGHPVVMGRKTWETLGGALPSRKNVVLTRRAGYAAPGARLARDLDEALAPFRNSNEEVFVVGGGEVYLEAMPSADRILLTVVDEAPEGDAFFPHVPEGLFQKVSREDRAGPPRHCFVRLERCGSA